MATRTAVAQRSELGRIFYELDANDYRIGALWQAPDGPVVLYRGQPGLPAALADEQAKEAVRQHLAALARDGWDPVGIIGGVLYLKR